MARNSNSARTLSAQPIPVILYHERRAADAFAAHQALVQKEMQHPELAENPAWQVLRADAFENFVLAFERV